MSTVYTIYHTKTKRRYDEPGPYITEFIASPHIATVCPLAGCSRWQKYVRYQQAYQCYGNPFVRPGWDAVSPRQRVSCTRGEREVGFVLCFCWCAARSLFLHDMVRTFSTYRRYGSACLSIFFRQYHQTHAQTSALIGHPSSYLTMQLCIL